MVWYLNRALTNLRNEVNARWPNRDKASDGTIGDAAHQGTASDHNPDPDGSVDAWDMDKDGVNVWEIIRKFEQHEAAQYWIYNRQIASRENNWRRHTYVGSNPHDKHVHFNTRKTFENSNKPWGLLEENDMTPAEHDMLETIKTKVDNIYSFLFFGGPSCGDKVPADNGILSNALVDKIDATLDSLRELVNRPSPTDVTNLIAALDRLAASLNPDNTP